MKKKTKEKLIRNVFFLVILIIGMATSYFLDFSGNLDLENNEGENEVANVSNNADISETLVEAKLQIHYIDVGQADAIIITQGEHVMMIDAGKNDTEDSVVNYIKEQGISKFDYIIGTHVHEDHIGGMDKVVENFEADNILFPKQTSTTKTLYFSPAL